MKKFIAAITILLMMMMTMGVVSSPAQADSTVKGCSKGLAHEMAQQWESDFGYWGSLGPTRIPYMFVVHLTATSLYWYCPNEKRVDKIKPIVTSYCWTHLEHHAREFDGVKFNTLYGDNSGVFIDPPSVKIDNNKGSQNCGDQIVKNTKWMKLDQYPVWAVEGFVVRKHLPDAGYNFMWGPSNRRPYDPLSDIPVGNWT